MSGSHPIPSPATARHPAEFFATTRWTLVLAAGDRSMPQAERALEELCRAYWYPLYAYMRRRGYSREDAEDLAQAFFARLLAKNGFAGLRAERGKFRAFLLQALKHFLANEWDRARRQKRGGHLTHLSLDWQEAEAQFQIADPNQLPPDRAYDREWATALLERVIVLLRAEWAAGGAAERFDHLKAYLTLDRERIPYAEAATALGMEAGAVRVAVHRLRKRYRELLRSEVAQTLEDPAMVEDELATLLEAFLP